MLDDLHSNIEVGVFHTQILSVQVMAKLLLIALHSSLYVLMTWPLSYIHTTFICQFKL